MPDFQRLMHIVEEAMALPHAERSAFLRQQCEADDSMFAAAKKLLAAEARGADFLDVTKDAPTTAEIPSFGERSSGLRFRILKPHAKGGLGEVYVAEDGELRREVALKEIQPQHADDPNARSRFVFEAEITGGLEHPGVVPVYGLGTYDDGRPYYAMRFVKGDDLRTAIKNFHGSAGGTPDFQSVAFRSLLRRFLDVCNAIGYAHSRGVLHRDLKPGNIMLGPFGETLVVDWGLAKVVGRTDASGEATLQPSSGESKGETLPGSAIGTPGYMSPEQADGRIAELGPATDVYALGAVLHSLLTGHAPVAVDGGLIAILERVKRGELLDAPNAPKALVAVSRKAMALDPSDRYSTTADLAADVDRWLADEAVHAHRDPLLARIRRWMRKRPGATAAMAATVLVGLAASAIGMVVVGGKNRDLAQANIDLTEAERVATERKQIAETESLRAHKAEGKAKEAAIQAAQERDIAVAVRRFLQNDLLRQASPWETYATAGGGGRFNPTVRELLDRATKGVAGAKLEKAFPKQPAVQAEILETLTEAHMAVGNDKDAIAQQLRAKSVWKAAFGAKHRSTLISQVRLAEAHLHALAFTDAASELVDVLQGLLELSKPAEPGGVEWDPESLATATAVLDACDAVWREGRFRMTVETPLPESYTPFFAIKMTQGFATVNSLLPRLKLAFGEDAASVLLIRQVLAIGNHLLGRKREALAESEDIVRLAVRSLGADDFRTATLRMLLANLYDDLGRLDDSVTQYVEIIRVMEKRFGADHPHTTTIRTQFGGVYAQRKMYERAIPLLQRGLQEFERNVGADHPEAVLARFVLGAAHFQSRQPALAVPYLEKSIPQLAKRFGANDARVLVTRHRLAASYSDAGRLDLAEPLLRQVAKELEAKLGAKHSEPNAAKFNIALLEYRKDKKAGLAALGQACENMEAALGAGHDVLNGARDTSLAAFEAQGEVDRGRVLAERSLQATAKAVGPDHPNTASARRRLVQFLIHLERFEEARVQSELAYKAFERGGFKQVDAARAASALARSLDGLKRHGEAAAWHRRAIELAEDNSRPGSMEWAGVMTYSVRNQLALKNWKEAERDGRRVAEAVSELVNKKILWPWHVEDAKSMLGESLLGQDKLADAEPLLKQAYEGLKKVESTIPPPFRAPRIHEAADRVRRLCEAKGDKTEAEKWRLIAEKEKPKPRK